MGASGFVGRQLVVELHKQAVELLLVGREPRRLEAIFPGVECCDYATWDKHARDFDAVVCLTVLNNNVQAQSEEFICVNVELPLEMAVRAKRAGIRRFVNVSSIHALDEANLTPYAITKRQAAEQLGQVDGIEIATVYLATVYGDSWAGKLAVLNRLPPRIARAIFLPFAALKPVVNVSRLAAFLLEPAPDQLSCVLSDTQKSQLIYHFVKRAVDVGVALAIAVFFWWFFLLIWVLIKRESPRPGIFAQPRIGQDGRLFTCYKFRTMRLGTPQLGTHEIAMSAVTGIGAWLRRTKLDELPQILNILRNEISVVGPRPCLPVQTALIEARRRRGVLALKPGITGFAQVNGIDMSDPERLATWDARYLSLQSLVLDAEILLSTLRGGGQGDRVRQ